MTMYGQRGPQELLQHVTFLSTPPSKTPIIPSLAAGPCLQETVGRDVLPGPQRPALACAISKDKVSSISQDISPQALAGQMLDSA